MTGAKNVWQWINMQLIKSRNSYGYPLNRKRPYRRTPIYSLLKQLVEAVPALGQLDSEFEETYCCFPALPFSPTIPLFTPHKFKSFISLSRQFRSAS